MWGRRTIGLVAFAHSLFLAAGCSPATGDVIGTVSYRGQSIPLGRITMYAEAGPKQGVSSAIQDGKFELKGVPAGLAKVTVESYGVTPDVAARPLPKGLSIPKEMAGRAKAAKRLPIPERYAKADESAITYDVLPGLQPKDFELK